MQGYIIRYFFQGSEYFVWYQVRDALAMAMGMATNRPDLVPQYASMAALNGNPSVSVAPWVGLMPLVWPLAYPLLRRVCPRLPRIAM